MHSKDLMSNGILAKLYACEGLRHKNRILVHLALGG